MAKMTPPPRVTPADVVAFAHCRDYFCEGYGQQEVPAVKTLLEWTGASVGSDPIFHGVVFTSVEEVQFKDPADMACEHCGVDREISATSRPTYQALSGHPQDGLLKVHGFDPSVRNTEADEAAAAAMAEQNQKIAELQALVEKLAGEKAEA